MCVVVCSDEHQRRPALWRIQNQNQLLLSHLKPYKEVQSSTISNWVKLVIKMAEIDTSL